MLKLKSLLIERPSTGSLTLPKLRKLFDLACQGIEDKDLLDDVYSEWHQFIKEMYEHCKQDVVRYDDEEEQEYLDRTDDIVKRMKHTFELLDRNYTKPYTEKLMAFNEALQEYHFDIPLLINYFVWMGKKEDADAEREVGKFLDWLSKRTSFCEKIPPNL